ncbi:hypothetical protein OO184_19985 [Photorhabdus sp. APURE]|nr:hypothetical protein [Photorhabdus aballayi]MCW7550148.1 hypothetical protein [Photorhabdus aballayi]
MMLKLMIWVNKARKTTGLDYCNDPASAWSVIVSEEINILFTWHELGLQ